MGIFPAVMLNSSKEVDVYLSFNSKRGEINATWVKVALSPKTLPDCPQIAADRIEKALEDNTLVALIFSLQEKWRRVSVSGTVKVLHTNYLQMKNFITLFFSLFL